MSELRVQNPPQALTVSEVEPDSPAARAGVRPGDLLREINRQPILDLLDYQFYAAEARLRVVIERAGEPRTLLIRKEASEPAGLTFAHDLGDKIHTCNNKCVFCFIHQMPKKMRKTLYLMDDDFRLSFMHGNYVTLTNVTDAEFQRILAQRLSPLYVSVHATDPVLRAAMLGKREPTPILPQIRTLADHRIDVHAQIVLCPGYNDGAALHQTLSELAAEHRSQTGKRAGVESVAIVPVGLTRFRERLPPLAFADRDYARAMIADLRRRERIFRQQLGTRFAWLSDEWHFLAQQPIPGAAHYEAFPQLEDGIGTVRLFLENARATARRLPARAPLPVAATLVTAELPAQVVQDFADRLNRIENVMVKVCVVKNAFFGGGINIAGLLTAQDIAAQLGASPAQETVYLPDICLRDGSLFLDDWTVDDLRREMGRDIRVVGTRPRDLAAALGLLPPPRARRAPGHWLIEDRVPFPDRAGPCPQSIIKKTAGDDARVPGGLT